MLAKLAISEIVRELDDASRFGVGFLRLLFGIASIRLFKGAGFGQGNRPMRPISFFIPFFVTSMLFGAQVTIPTHAANLSVEMREQIEVVVKDYLLKNPEIIRDATAALAKQEEANKQALAARAVVESRDALLNDRESPVGGNPRGDITIVEFFDYNCGYCKRVAPELQTLSKADKKVRIVYKELPILGPTSLLAAKAALAANRQGKYVAFHEALFGLPEISDASLKALSKTLALDHARLVKDMDDPAIMALLQRDRELANKLSINGTPAFVIGDRLVPGALDASSLQQIVNQERAGAKK